MLKDLIIRLRDAVLNNKGVKLLSLLLATITWYSIRETISFETVVSDVPLTVQVDPGWAVGERSTDSVDVSFRGSQEDLLRLNRDNVEVVLDVRGKRVGGMSALALGPDLVKAPGGARAAFVRPGVVSLSLDTEGEKQVPVKADIQGSPPEGYEVERVVCTPASVTVKGPRQRLEEIEALKTAPIDMEGRLRAFRVRAQVLGPGQSWVVRVEPDKVAVEVTLAERSASRTVEDVAVKALVDAAARAGATIQPNRIAIKLEGRQEALDRLTAQDLDAYVDCTKLDPEARYDLPVRVYAPGGVRIAGTEPATVSVLLEAR